MCRALVRLLRDEHEVLVATDGLDALELFEAGQRFDAIVSDIDMPNLSGADLRRALIRFAPEQVDRLIYFTGAASSNLAAQLQTNLVVDKTDIGQMRALVGRVVEAAVSGYFPEARKRRAMG
jgi:CheY-like chemotaxis protein